MINASFVPKLAKKARLKHDRHSKQTLLLYPERGLELNDVAASIAEKIDGARSVRVIAEELAVEYDAETAVIEEDVIAFLGDLRDRGLLEIE